MELLLFLDVFFIGAFIFLSTKRGKKWLDKLND